MIVIYNYIILYGLIYFFLHVYIIKNVPIRILTNSNPSNKSFNFNRKNALILLISCISLTRYLIGI